MASVPIDRRRRVVPRRPGWDPALGAPAGLLLALPLIAVLALFLLLPAAMLIKESFAAGGTAAYGEFFTDPVSLRALGRTLVSSVVVAGLAILLGGALAWRLRVARTSWSKAVIWMAILIPLWMSVIIKNYAFMVLLGRGGLLSTAWGLFFHGQQITLMYTQWAVIMGMLYSMLPYAALPLYVTFRSVDLDLLAAAENLGASRLQALTGIALPLARPGLVATGIIVFVISLGFYVTPVLLGGIKSPYLPSLIEEDIFKYFDEESARVAAAVLLIMAAIIIGSAMKLLGARQLQRVIR